MGKSSNNIGRLDSTSWTWSLAGKLETSRYGHSAIFVDSKLVVVGGSGSRATEFCEVHKGHFICEKQPSLLKDYASYPLLFPVSDDYIDC